MMASLSWASGCPAWAALVTSLTAPARSPAWYRCPAWVYEAAPGSCSQYGALAADMPANLAWPGVIPRHRWSVPDASTTGSAANAVGPSATHARAAMAATPSRRARPLMDPTVTARSGPALRGGAGEAGRRGHRARRCAGTVDHRHGRSEDGGGDRGGREAGAQRRPFPVGGRHRGDRTETAHATPPPAPPDAGRGERDEQVTRRQAQELLQDAVGRNRAGREEAAGSHRVAGEADRDDGGQDARVRHRRARR